MRHRDARWLLQKRQGMQGANIRPCKKAWELVGGTHQPVPKTGETRYDHPDLTRPIIVGRSKSAPRILVHAIIRLSGDVLRRDGWLD